MFKIQVVKWVLQPVQEILDLLFLNMDISREFTAPLDLLLFP